MPASWLIWPKPAATLSRTKRARRFPDDVFAQVDGAIRGLRRAWNSRRARMRREALGTDPDAPLAVIVQAMALGLGANAGAGFADLRDAASGRRRLSGRYLADAQGEDAILGLRTPMLLTCAERDEMEMSGPAVEDVAPDIIGALRDAGERLEAAVGDAVSLEFTREAGALRILDVRRARRSARAAVEIAVDLASRDVISRRDALMRGRSVALGRTTSSGDRSGCAARYCGAGVAGLARCGHRRAGVLAR